MQTMAVQIQDNYVQNVTIQHPTIIKLFLSKTRWFMYNFDKKEPKTTQNVLIWSFF
jgi:hypothetical protein